MRYLRCRRRLLLGSPQNFSSDDNLFFYTSGDNNVVRLIQPTPDSAYTMESYITDEDVVNTMVDDILEAMELKNGKICDASDSRCVRRYEMDDETYSLSDGLEQNTRD